MKTVETRSLTAELRVAQAADGTRTISGVIPYGSESVDLGGFTEVINRGAFSAALAPEADVLALRDHDPKLLLGRTKSGTLSLSDSPDGLRYTINLPNTTHANDLAESVKRGDLDSTSFGFQVLDDSWEKNSTGTIVRSLNSVNLLEVSPCSFPAYPASRVSIRSCPAELRSEVHVPKALVAEDDETPAVEETPVQDKPLAPKPDEEHLNSEQAEQLRNYMHMQLVIRKIR